MHFYLKRKHRHLELKHQKWRNMLLLFLTSIFSKHNSLFFLHTVLALMFICCRHSFTKIQLVKLRIQLCSHALYFGVCEDDFSAQVELKTRILKILRTETKFPLLSQFFFRCNHKLLYWSFFFHSALKCTTYPS